MQDFEVLGLGAVAVDDILYLPTHPEADAKVRILHQERHGGGLAATALVAASRLGARCAYAGTLGADELSVFSRDVFRAEGVDTSLLVQREEARPIHATILVDTRTGSRTILLEVPRVTGADPDLPAPEVIRSCRVLLLDHLGVPGMIRAASLAREAGIPTVADFEPSDSPRFPELLSLADHLILSADFAASLTGAAGPAAAAEALWNGARRAVVVTQGAEGSWHLCAETGGKPRHRAAFRVQAVDTTGCGDVFHGAYAAALCRGMGMEERVRFASAAAAIKAGQPGGQRGAPTRRQVEEFLAGRG
jgi:sulfofructose kinase